MVGCNAIGAGGGSGMKVIILLIGSGKCCVTSVLIGTRGMTGALLNRQRDNVSYATFYRAYSRSLLLNRLQNMFTNGMNLDGWAAGMWSESGSGNNTAWGNPMDDLKGCLWSRRRIQHTLRSPPSLHGSASRDGQPLSRKPTEPASVSAVGMDPSVALRAHMRDLHGSLHARIGLTEAGLTSQTKDKVVYVCR